MPWPIVMHDEKPLNPKPGDAWYLPALVEGPHAVFYREHLLSPEYLRDWDGKRPPIAVMCPDGTPWVIDERYGRDDATGHRVNQGWTVTGDPPNITAMPSINVVGRYHGWLRDGVLSDDIEGRTF